MATEIQGPAPFIDVNFWLTGPFWEDRGPSHVPRYHKGVDLATSSGNSAFYSIQNGEVIGKGYTSGYGYYLITRDPNTGISFFYADMDEASSLAVGDIVVLNTTLIGYEGSPRSQYRRTFTFRRANISRGRELPYWGWRQILLSRSY